MDASAVAKFADSSRFRQKLSFDCKTTSSQLTVTYALAGNEAEDAPVVLFCGGMYGGRWHGPWIDYLAQMKRVKVLIVDRPGVGGSTQVSIGQRIPVWLETVPAILAHLRVSVVTLASHSCGSLFALNTLVQLPELCAPDIFLLAPWVHPSKSGVKMLTLLSAMPSGLVNSWNAMNSFLVNKMLPFSERFSRKKKTMQQDQTSATGAPVPLQQSDAAKEPVTAEKLRKLQETCGYSSMEEKDNTREHFIKRFFAESTAGCSDDMNLALKPKSATGQWYALNAEDYGPYVEQLSKTLRERDYGSGDGRRLVIHAFFGANDTFVGPGGMKYFVESFNSVTSAVDVLDFRSELVPELDHDGLALPERGIVEKIFDSAQACGTATRSTTSTDKITHKLENGQINDVASTLDTKNSSLSEVSTISAFTEITHLPQIKVISV